MTGRSNWENKNNVLNRLDPSRRAEAEARAAARKNVSNEAIKLPEAKSPPSSEQGLTSHSLGTGAAARAARAMKAGSTNKMPDEAK
jgi:hypothetical protein